MSSPPSTKLPSLLNYRVVRGRVVETAAIRKMMSPSKPTLAPMALTMSSEWSDQVSSSAVSPAQFCSEQLGIRSPDHLSAFVPLDSPESAKKYDLMSLVRAKARNRKNAVEEVAGRMTAQLTSATLNPDLDAFPQISRPQSVGEPIEGSCESPTAAASCLGRSKSLVTAAEIMAASSRKSTVFASSLSPKKSKPVLPAKATIGELDSLMENARAKAEIETQNRQPQKKVETNLSEAMRFVKDLSKPKKKDRQSFGYWRWYFQWAIGQVLNDREKKNIKAIASSKNELEKLRKAREQAEKLAREETRCLTATTFFTDVFRKLRAGKQRSALLTEDKYHLLKSQFSAICGTEDLAIPVKELIVLLEKRNAQLDTSLFKKLDRDHSGTIEFEELLHMLYPAIPFKDLKVFRKKWDGPKEKPLEVLREENFAKLSQESKDEIIQNFRHLDTGRKGVLVRSDLEHVFDQPSDAEFLFPTPTTVLTLDDYMDFMKAVYPPFLTGDQLRRTGEGARLDMNPFSKEFLEYQEKVFEMEL